MIKETGIVKLIDNNLVWVETQVKTTCGTCQAANNCGTSTIAKAFTPKAELLKLSTTTPLYIGQKVVLGIPERRVVTASMLMYLLPIVVLMLSAIGFDLLLKYANMYHEIGVVVMSLFAMMICFFLMSKRAKRYDKHQFDPSIIGVFDDNNNYLTNIDVIELK